MVMAFVVHRVVLFMMGSGDYVVVMMVIVMYVCYSRP